MLGLFVCKKRLEKENAQWITGNYATQSARQRKKVCGYSQSAGQEAAHAAKGEGTAEQKTSRTRRTGRNPFLFGRLFLAACRKESRHAKKRQNYYIKHKTAAKFAGAAKPTGGGTALRTMWTGARFSSVGVQTKRACWKQTACPNTRSAMRGFAGSSKRGNGITKRLSRNRA